MKVTVFGCGYVGLVTGVCLADMRHEVECVDTQPTRIAQLANSEIPFAEPGLGGLITAALDAEMLHFASLPSRDADICIIAVGSPLAESGAADLTQVFAAARAICGMAQPPKVVVIKSTVPPGTSRAIGRFIRSAHPDWQFDMVSNPEFLRQGSAVADFMHPERLVIGADTAAAIEVMDNLYQGLDLPVERLVKTGVESAELTKYAANVFLTTKIAFMNELADLSDSLGADIGDVAKGIGLDSRIGPDFLQVGPGIGGSCFPKDIQALAHLAQDAGKPLRIIEAVIKANAAHLEAMVAKIMALCGGEISGQKIAVLGVAFKANTDDTRSSPALAIISALLGAGARVHVVDPEVDKSNVVFNGPVVWEQDAYNAATGADAIVVLTEWAAFEALDLVRLAACSNTPRLADLRNIFSKESAEKAGFSYTSIGR